MYWKYHEYANGVGGGAPLAGLAWARAPEECQQRALCFEDELNSRNPKLPSVLQPKRPFLNTSLMIENFVLNKKTV